MSLLLPDPSSEIDRIVKFLIDTFRRQQVENVVIAVSGGIDSAVSLALLARAMTVDHIYPLLLPYGDQDMSDAVTVCEWAGIKSQNCQKISITPIVEQMVRALDVPSAESVRLGNIMARSRMIITYDKAKELSALVCGTENKSEKYLGYFTRFGDEASDIEPLQHLYKTQVRSLAEFLQIPEPIRRKAPSAGLWWGQTDESELGFSYEDADQVIDRYIDQKKTLEEIDIAGIKPETVQKILQRVSSQAFKLQVPYVLSTSAH